LEKTARRFFAEDHVLGLWVPAQGRDDEKRGNSIGRRAFLRLINTARMVNMQCGKHLTPHAFLYQLFIKVFNLADICGVDVMARFSSVKRLAAGLAVVSAVGLSGSIAHAELIVNGGFEAPALVNTQVPNDSGNYAYPGGTFDSWTYQGGTGLVDTSQGSNAWYPAGTPPSGYVGNQFAFLQSGGVTNNPSILSQSFDSLVAGLTTISWLDAGRPNTGCCNGNQTYEVLLNNTVIGQFSTTNGQNFKLESLTGTLVAGTNSLAFVGEATTDQTTFLDNVSVASIPEASTWAMMLLGFAAVGFMTYRRNSRPAFLAA
jgi:hypothetical protein